MKKRREVKWMIFLLLFWATSLIVRSANVVNYYHTISTMPTPLLYKKAENFYKHDHADSALICYTIITKRTPVNEEQEKNLRNTWYQLWKIYLEQYNDYVKAKECLLKLQELCVQQKQSLAMCYMMYGVIYDTMAQQVVDDSLRMEAIRSYRKSIQAYRDKQDNPALVYSFTNIVSSLSTLEEVRSVKSEYIALQKAKGDKKLAMPYHFALLLYPYMEAKIRGQYQKAIAYCGKMLQLAGTKKENRRYWLYVYIARAQLNSRIKRYDLALADAKTVERMGILYDLKDVQLLAYQDMAKYYGLVGDSVLAERYHQRHIALKDSLLNYQQVATVKEMSFLKEMKQFEKDLEESERSRSRWIAFFVVTAIVACGGVASFVWVRRKNHRLMETNEKLYEKNLEMLQRDEEAKRQRQEQESAIMETSYEREMTIEIEKYKGSNLDAKTKDLLYAKIRDVMETSVEVFNPEFSIYRLAELVDAKSKAVSQVINELCGHNFKMFVNEYRIKEACKRMNDAQYKQFTIEAMGNGVGFKSRNSFITAFKRFTGLTPSDYQAIANKKAQV